MNLLKKIISSFLFVSFLVFATLFLQNHVKAATPTLPQIPDQTSLGVCGNPNLFSNNLLVPQALSGKLYAKLPSTESAMTVYLYSQPIFGNTCTPIGSGLVSPNAWTYIGQINNSALASTIIAEGSNLEGEPYSADLDLLSIPSSNPCVINGNSCVTTFEGYRGSLASNLVSADTSQVALYVAQPINKAAVTSVNYYADGTFIYSSNKLLPVNRDYLDGGVHAVQIQVNFAHGETFIINKSINMGTDWTGSLLLKSIFYRSKNKVAFFVFIGTVILVIVLALALARYIYKLRKFKREHGLTKENLKKIKDVTPDDDPGPKMHVG